MPQSILEMILAPLLERIRGTPEGQNLVTYQQLMGEPQALPSPTPTPQPTGAKKTLQTIARTLPGTLSMEGLPTPVPELKQFLELLLLSPQSRGIVESARSRQAQLNQPELVTGPWGGVYQYTPATGEMAQRIPGRPTFQSTARGIYGVGPGGAGYVERIPQIRFVTDEGKLSALDEETGKEIWFKKLAPEWTDADVVYEEEVVMTTDPETGEEIPMVNPMTGEPYTRRVPYLVSTMKGKPPSLETAKRLALSELEGSIARQVQQEQAEEPGPKGLPPASELAESILSQKDAITAAVEAGLDEDTLQKAMPTMTPPGTDPVGAMSLIPAVIELAQTRMPEIWNAKTPKGKAQWVAAAVRAIMEGKAVLPEQRQVSRFWPGTELFRQFLNPPGYDPLQNRFQETVRPEPSIQQMLTNMSLYP